MINKIILIVLIIFALFACKKDTSPISIDFSGIAETDEYNLLLNDDPNDWQPRCRSGSSGIYCMLPAFPNPTDSVITFLFYLNQQSHVSAIIYDKPNHQIAEIGNSLYPIGFNKIPLVLKGNNQYYFENGLYNIKFKFVVNGKSYESSGDFLIH